MFVSVFLCVCVCFGYLYWIYMRGWVGWGGGVKLHIDLICYWLIFSCFLIWFDNIEFLLFTLLIVYPLIPFIFRFLSFWEIYVKERYSLQEYLHCSVLFSLSSPTILFRAKVPLGMVRMNLFKTHLKNSIDVIKTDKFN